MNFAEAKALQAEVRASRKTHWVLRLVTKTSDEYRTMAKDNPSRRIFGAFDPEFLDGATVYAGGAVNPSSVGTYSVVALTSDAWKGKKR